MKAAYPFLVATAMAATVMAQQLAEPTDKEAMSDAVQKAIDEFNRAKKEGKSGENEVVVVLDPLPADKEEPTDGADEPAETEKPEVDHKDSEPVLVTGKPPEEELPDVRPDTETETASQAEELVEPAPEPVAEAEAGIPEPETAGEPELEVRVESIRKGSGLIDPGQVKLKASFPAKPLSSAPEGWLLEKSEQAPVFRKEVELQPGTSISLSIKPHILTPGSDGFNTFSVGEPGFDASQGYLQQNTVSAILSTSVAQLDKDSLQLGNAISELHRLLSSLPKPEPQPEDIAKPKKP